MGINNLITGFRRLSTLMWRLWRKPEALVVVLAVAACFAGAFQPVRSQTVDASKFRAVVERQLDAFRRDDAAAAYALASPSIRTMFPLPEIFMRMVRDGYPPVYRPADIVFGLSRAGAAGPELVVHLKDAAGTDWDAIYTFDESGPEPTISGCRLIKSPGESV